MKYHFNFGSTLFHKKYTLKVRSLQKLLEILRRNYCQVLLQDYEYASLLDDCDLSSAVLLTVPNDALVYERWCVYLQQMIKYLKFPRTAILCETSCFFFFDQLFTVSYYTFNVTLK